MAQQDAPYFPIIYVRGYAMTQGEQDQTAADPFCGFNVGSTTYRAVADKKAPPKKFVFESPVLRLASDFGYADVYEDGLDILDADWAGRISNRSVIIYRYYDQASTLLGTGETPPIEDFAKGLSELILRVRDRVCAQAGAALAPKDFRCYLVAHSMGGLVCRAFLQNPALGDDAARACVDKLFTYATPHNGIDVRGINVPKWLGLNDIDNFNRERMAKYLKLEALYKKTGRVDWLPESVFPSRKVFCMVGSNRSDYDAAMGLSRSFVGHGSDGLVKIDNASVWGVNSKGEFSAPSATAFTYRSHSGPYGIVNSEEAYQNLTRFLFGDVRVDIWLDIDEVRLPPALAGNKNVDAVYQIEAMASPRGKRWYLTRRIAAEDSVACRSHKALAQSASKLDRHVYLSTVFLANRARVDQSRPSLAYSLSLGVRAPDYEVEKRFWADDHYEGGYLFRDGLIVELVPPAQAGGEWKIHYDWESDNPVKASSSLDFKTLKSGDAKFIVPFDSGTAPGISGQIRFLISAWNA